VDKEFEELEKEDKEFEQRTARMKAKAKAEAQRAAADIAETVRGLKAAFVDGLTDELFKVAKAGGDVDAAAKAARDKLVADIKARGVQDEANARGAADEILATAKETAVNALASGQPPKLQKQQDTARGKVVAKVARDFEGADVAEADLFTRVTAQGQDREKARQEVEEQVRGEIAGKGVDPKVAQDAAAAVVSKAWEAVEEALANKTLPAGVKKRVDALDQAFLPGAEAAIAANRAAQAAGLPIAQTDRRARAMEQSGTPFALPEAKVREQLERDVAGRLRAAGQRPELARPIVGRAFERQDQRFAESLARNPDRMAAAREAADQAQAAAMANQARVPGAVRRQGRQVQQFDQQAAQQQFSGMAARGFGANPAEAQQVGRKAAALMGKGANPEQALHQALLEVMAAYRQNQARLAQLEAQAWAAANNIRAARQNQGNMRARRGPVGAGWFGGMMGFGG
jgi:hypothetical protein